LISYVFEHFCCPLLSFWDARGSFWGLLGLSWRKNIFLCHWFIWTTGQLEASNQSSSSVGALSANDTPSAHSACGAHGACGACGARRVGFHNQIIVNHNNITRPILQINFTFALLEMFFCTSQYSTDSAQPM